ncbi:RAB6A-GEF complex partner protein 2 isoform X2 [Phymastichus coffea]|uniref:RAB6A-GEF complex partner protein 2 isoform X2 n=1 Tax=Phymastichus coffea TaxID=108790 RepID=UPI00273BD5B8|nr:RAB6A-GEF complex partner protein 2 isoform X2 [Phymastichus coffea]
MIDITAKLLNGSTFFASEDIECEITFSCPEFTENSENASSEEAQDNSAQIHCQCSINEKLILVDKIKKDAKPTIINSVTTFDPSSSDNGHAVLITKPKILFCDMKLSPGESKSFVYKENIPIHSPPSYLGQAVRYSYKITIGTQRVNSPIKLLKIPFRVLPLREEYIIREVPEATACNENHELACLNIPDLDLEKLKIESQPKETDLEIALQTLQNITARRSPNYYNITNQRGRVVRFCLFKNSYKLGEDIIGTFDFSNATVSCTQVSVTLQSEEYIAEEFKKGKTAVSLSSYNKHHEVVIGYLYTHLMLPIPFHITPDFSTDLVNLKWRLHFEFVTAVKPIEFPDENTMNWQAPSTVDIETMVWDLPVHIYPTTVPPNITPVVQNSIVI